MSEIKSLTGKTIILRAVRESDINDRYANPRGENGIEGRRYFVKFTPDNSGNHTHHIHIYQKGNTHISDELMFRG